MPGTPARTSPETTWRAEWFANTVSDMQNERQAQKEHRCGNCGNNPFMRSTVRCVNDAGGK